MPRTKSQPNPPPQPVSPSTQGNGSLSEVFTLGEAAAYLRLGEAEVLQLVHEQRLPARQLGKEWRFLKRAIQDWLRAGPLPMPSKEAQLAVAGAWKDDPYVDEELN